MISESKDFKAVEATRTGDITKCNLWSRVKYVGDNNQSLELVNPPYVHWEKANKRNSSDFHPLRDVFYWYSEEGLSFIHSVRHYCEFIQEDNVYDCGITVQRCSSKYLGTYKYGIYDFDSGSQIEQTVFLKVERGDSSYNCYMPRAENITAEFIIGDKGMHLINISWEYTERPRGQRYCDYSRQWQIRGFNSTSPHPFEDGKEPSLFRNVEFLNTTHRRETFFTFQINETQRNNYFQFQLRNRRIESKGFITRKYNSSIFTFKEQGKCMQCDFAMS